ncbi:HNH endonuclease [Saliphagus sp. LR7]|uniref:HNH endonuclease n=1 Tax=Saliphagus sp. LR7 TaxID=2282654 RepID=UPI000DF833F8|nr:HNH endonuclease [Saliphagus sp. LR7]
MPDHDVRQLARNLYWGDHDESSHACPGCGRPRDAIDGIELHHRDHRKGNPGRNNLIGLCRDCHQEGQHGNRSTSKHLEAPTPRDVSEPSPNVGKPGF